MQTLKELLSEIEDLRSLVALTDKKSRAPGKVPVSAAPKAPDGAAPALTAQPVTPVRASMKLETWSPGKKKDDTAPAATGTNPGTPPATTLVIPTVSVPTTATSTAATPRPPSKGKIDPAAKDKASVRLKEIIATPVWQSARYAAASALDEKVSDIEFEASLGKLKQQITNATSLVDGLDDARELVKTIRNKTVWKEEKSVPEDRKAHVRKTELLLVELMDGNDTARSAKIAEMLYENGTRGEIRVPAGRKLGHSESDILFREWQVKGRKLEQAQLELIYSTSRNWREKWLAGKELGLKQAATDVYENKDAEREDRMEASKLLAMSACDFALHERKLGKELKKEDLKQIWIHAKDLEVRNAAARELGHSSAKIWMSEHPEVIVGAGVVFLVLVGITVIWRPWRHLPKAALSDTPSEQAATAPKLVVTNSTSGSDTPSPVAAPVPADTLSLSDTSSSSVMSSVPDKPSAIATTTLPASNQLTTSTSSLGKLPDEPAETVDLAGIMSSGSAAAKTDPTVAPPDLPDIPDDQPENATDSMETAPAVKIPEPATTAPAGPPIVIAPVAIPSPVIVQITDKKSLSNSLPASPVGPASATIAIAVRKSTNVAGIVSNKLPVVISPPPKAIVASGSTGKAVKVVSPVVAATNAPKAVLVVKSTNVVGTISNKVLSTATVPAKVTIIAGSTGKVVKAVAPVSISTNSLKTSSVVKVSTNTLPQKPTVPARALVPSASTNTVIKTIVPVALPAGSTE